MGQCNASSGSQWCSMAVCGNRATNALDRPDVDLARGEPPDLARGDRDAELLGDLVGEIGVRGPREEHEVLLGDDLHPDPPC